MKKSGKNRRIRNCAFIAIDSDSTGIFIRTENLSLCQETV